MLDKLVAEEYLASLPVAYSNCLGTSRHPVDAMCIDTDLYLVHLIPHAYVALTYEIAG